MFHSTNVLYWCKEVSPQKKVALESAAKSLALGASEEDVLQQLKTNHVDILLISKEISGGALEELIVKLKKRFRNLVIIAEQKDYRSRDNLLRLGVSDVLIDALWQPEVLGHIFLSAARYVDLDRQRRESVFQFKKLENRLNTIMKNTPVILFMLDAEGKFTMGTGKLFDKFKVDKQFVIGQKLKEVYHAYPSFIEAFSETQKGSIQKFTITINEVIFEIVLTPVMDRNEELSEVFGIASDVTERVQSEFSLIKGKQMAEEAARVKQEFIANMSHEIRTPLNAIIGFVNLLYDSSLDEVQLDYVASAQMASENLMSLINSILDFSKIENGTLRHESEEFNLKHVINSIDKVLSLKVLEKKIDFEVEVKESVPLELVGDPNRLYQIVTNLLANSVKFTETGGVKLIVAADQQVLDQVNVEFTVIDTGIGIPEHMQSKVFESFTQVNSESNRKYGGTGLGLSIVKKIVEQLKGKISMESQPLKGTTFKVVLPFKVAEVPAARKKKLIAVKGDLKLPEGIKILLAEDNLMNQKLVLQILKNFSVQTDLAETGLEAVKAHRSNKYDLILMDIQMPEIDGIEATAIIRNELEADRRDVPIIAMTAHAFQEELQKCLQVGMNDHVIKPINVDSFIQAINKAISGQGKNKQDSYSLDYLKEMFGRDELVIRDILQTFILEAPELIGEMKVKYRDQEFEALGRIAHKAKSSFKMLGMTEVVLQLQEIEKRVKSNTKVDVSEQIKSVEAAFHQLEPMIKTEIANVG